MYQGMIIFTIVLGIGMIILSMTTDTADKSTDKNIDPIKKPIDPESYETLTEELNTKILELNEFGSFILGEMEKKHKELLFLYQMICEKEKSFATEDEKLIKTENAQLDTQIQPREATKPDSIKLTIGNDSLALNGQILLLSNQGVSVQEIAKKLKIGQGEVQLILKLYQ